MSIIKKGTLTVVANTTAQNLALGFHPSYFYMQNKTKLAATTNGVVIAEWWSDMANAAANIWTTSGGDGTIKLTQISTNGFTPYETADDLLFVPDQAPYTTYKSTNLVITDISKEANASVTATHSFTSADVGVTWVTFSQVVGMTQINTMRGLIQSVTSTTSFTVNIDSSSFSTYTSGGIANVITGAPATTQFGTQIQMTPSYNRGTIGLTLGTSLMVSQNDVWEYYALLDTSANG